MAGAGRNAVKETLQQGRAVACCRVFTVRGFSRCQLFGGKTGTCPGPIPVPVHPAPSTYRPIFETGGGRIEKSQIDGNVPQGREAANNSYSGDGLRCGERGRGGYSCFV